MSNNFHALNVRSEILNYSSEIHETTVIPKFTIPLFSLTAIKERSRERSIATSKSTVVGRRSFPFWGIPCKYLMHRHTALTAEMSVINTINAVNYYGDEVSGFTASDLGN